MVRMEVESDRERRDKEEAQRKLALCEAEAEKYKVLYKNTKQLVDQYEPELQKLHYQLAD